MTGHANETIALRLIAPAARPAWAELVAALHGVTPACSTSPAEWFADDPADAIEACGYCPAVEPCRRYGEIAREPCGVWGGRQLGLKQRRAVITPATPSNPSAALSVGGAA